MNNISTETTTILGFDPGRDKCGVAIMDNQREIIYHQVINSASAISKIKELSQQFGVCLVIVGDGTTSKNWRSQIELDLPNRIQITTVNEKNSTLEARDRYWLMYPPKGLQRLIPQGLKVPPRPVDDIVAILLIERYLKTI